MQLQDEPSNTSLLALGDLNPAIIIDEEEHSMVLHEEEEILQRPESAEPPRPGPASASPQGPQPIIIQFQNAPYLQPSEMPEPRQNQQPEPLTISEQAAPPAQRARPVVHHVLEREPDATPWVPVPRRDSQEPAELQEHVPFDTEMGPNAFPRGDWSPSPAVVTPSEGVEEAEEMEAEERSRPLVKRPEKVANLMTFLNGLSGFLPEEKLDLLHSDEIHLKLDQIRRSLSSGDQSNLPDTSPLPENGEDGAAAKQKMQVLMQRLKDKLGE